MKEYGKLQIIFGPMFSGKTEELIKRLVYIRDYEKRTVLVLKPKKDTRSDEGLKKKKNPVVEEQSVDAMILQMAGRVTKSQIKTAKGETFPASNIEAKGSEIFRAMDVFRYETGRIVDVIAIDEIQFFSENVYEAIDTLLERGIDVIVAGLKSDFRRQPFETSTHLVALVENSSDITILSACCKTCNTKTQFTQRSINGEPAPYSDKIEKVGGEESYEAKCRRCHILPGKTPYF